MRQVCAGRSNKVTLIKISVSQSLIDESQHTGYNSSLRVSPWRYRVLLGLSRVLLGLLECTGVRLVPSLAHSSHLAGLTHSLPHSSHLAGLTDSLPHSSHLARLGERRSFLRNKNKIKNDIIR
jgi:hypothetical protein